VSIGIFYFRVCRNSLVKEKLVLNEQLIRLGNKVTCHNTYVIVQQCQECVKKIWEYVCKQYSLAGGMFIWKGRS